MMMMIHTTMMPTMMMPTMMIPTMMMAIDSDDDNDGDNDNDNGDDTNDDARDDDNDDDHDDDDDVDDNDDDTYDEDNHDDNDDANDDDSACSDEAATGRPETCKRVPAHRPFSQQFSSPHQPEATSPKLQNPRPHRQFRPLCSYCFCCQAAQIKFQVVFFGGWCLN